MLAHFSPRAEFLAKHTITPGGDITNAIHVIWYVIDASTGRVESKQIRSFVRMFPQVPIFIILNKIDKSTQEEADSIGMLWMLKDSDRVSQSIRGPWNFYSCWRV